MLAVGLVNSEVTVACVTISSKQKHLLLKERYLIREANESYEHINKKTYKAKQDPET